MSMTLARVTLASTSLALLGTGLAAVPAQAATTSTSSVQGTVVVRTTTSQGAALQNGTVHAWKRSGQSWTKVQSSPLNSSGAYHLTNLPLDGDYRLEVVPRNANEDHAWFAHEFAFDAWTIDDADTFSPSGGAQAMPPIMVDEAYVYTGLIDSQLTRAAVPGATLTFTNAAGAEKTLVSDTLGRFDTTDFGFLHAGDHELTVEPSTAVDAPGLLPQTLTVSARLGGGRGHRITLDELRTAVFTIFDTDGETTLPGATVELFEQDEDGSYPEVADRMATADETGRVRLLESPDARLRITPPSGYAGTGVAHWWAGRGHSGVEDADDAIDLSWPEHAARRRDFHAVLSPAPAGPGDPGDPGETTEISAATPTITGSPRAGATLKANPGGWSPAAAVLSHQWLADGVPIDGATGSSLRVTNALAGQRVSVRVTGVLAGAEPQQRTSTATTPVVGTMTATKPTITGKTRVGKPLRARLTPWSPSPSLSYQWLRNGKPIKGATKQRYRLTRKDAGKRISVRVTGTRTWYATAATTSKRTQRIKR